MSTSDELYRIAYDELRGLARHYLQGDGAAGTIRPTELVSEAVTNLYGKVDFKDQQHLVATLARAMRRVLVNAARERSRLRHGNNAVHVTLYEGARVTSDHTVDVLAIDSALETLAEKKVRVAQVAEMTIFSGFTQDEIANQLGVTKRTVVNDWALARAWLARELDLRPARSSDQDASSPR